MFKISQSYIWNINLLINCCFIKVGFEFAVKIHGLTRPILKEFPSNNWITKKWNKEIVSRRASYELIYAYCFKDAKCHLHVWVISRWIWVSPKHFETMPLLRLAAMRNAEKVVYDPKYEKRFLKTICFKCVSKDVLMIFQT